MYNVKCNVSRVQTKQLPRDKEQHHQYHAIDSLDCRDGTGLVEPGLLLLLMSIFLTPSVMLAPYGGGGPILDDTGRLGVEVSTYDKM